MANYQDDGLNSNASKQSGKSSGLSTTAQTMVDLTKKKYQVSPKASESAKALIIDVTLVDGKAAILRTKVNKECNPDDLLQLNGVISSALTRMQQSKSTMAFHAQYAQDFSVLQKDSQQKTLEAEGIRKGIGSFIATLHEQIPSLISDYVLRNEAGKGAKSKLEEMSRSLNTLDTQANRAIINLGAHVGKLSTLEGRASSIAPAPSAAPTAPRPSSQEKMQPE